MTKEKRKGNPMENQQQQLEEASKSTAACAFRRHCRSHLKSQTYLTLVQIISQCHVHPHLLEVSRPPRPSPENCSNEFQQVPENEPSEQFNLVGPDETNHESDSLAQKAIPVDEKFGAIGFQDRGFIDTQMVIDEMENLLQVEEEDVMSKQRPDFFSDGFSGTGLQDTHIGKLQQVLIEELENAVEGNEQDVHNKHCNLEHMPSEMNHTGGGMVESSNNQEEHLDFQSSIADESRSLGEQHVDAEHSDQNVSEVFDSSLENITMSETSNPGGEDKSLLLRTSVLETDHKAQPKEVELVNLVHACGGISSSGHVIEEGRIGDGEISGKPLVNDRLVGALYDDALVSNKTKAGDKQGSDVIDDSKFLLNEKKEPNGEGSAPDTVETAGNTREAVANISIRNEMASKRKVVVYEDPILAEGAAWDKEGNKGHRSKEQRIVCATKEQKKGSGAKEQKKRNVSKDGATCPVAFLDNLGLNGEKLVPTSKDEKEVGMSKKRKQGPSSEEKREKKKQKKRKKRAEKNRKLGVKRLKLRPVLNPKPVPYCRHYLKGRCHEGEKCKFSHDTIPLTKSKPCCHFARRSCMKGEDCPFDHQLSKYTCTNYVSKGSCSRGEECMFSHTLPMKGDIPSTSNATASELRPLSSPGASNSERQTDVSGTLHQIVKALPDSVAVISHHNSGKSVPNATWNVPAVVPKGISFLSARKSPTVDSSHPIIESQSLIKEGFKVGNQTEQSASGVDSVEVGHRTDKVASGTVPLLNEIPKVTPVAPKGINFLSYFRSPVKCSSSNKLICLPINKDDGVKLSLSNTLEKIEPTVAHQKPSLFSFGEASSDGFRNNKRANLPSGVGSGADASAQTRITGSFRHQNSSAIPACLSGSRISSAQLSDHLAFECLKNAPSSTQKALMSTLAFASRVGAEMKMNGSIIDAHTGSSGVKERPAPGSTSNGSPNVSAKA